jgi:hypothetical protein
MSNSCYTLKKPPDYYTPVMRVKILENRYLSNNITLRSSRLLKFHSVWVKKCNKLVQLASRGVPGLRDSADGVNQVESSKRSLQRPSWYLGENGALLKIRHPQ